MTITKETISKIAHDANNALRADIGEPHGEYTADARDSALKGIDLIKDTPNITPEEQHEAWMEIKIGQGWQYGERRDDEKKLHPCLVPYDQLSAEQKAKDALFCAIVRSLLPFLGS